MTAMAEAARARTLLVFTHPALERTRVNWAMAEAARTVEGVTFHDLYEAYPDFAVDVDEEQQRLTAHDLIVLQFPLYWYTGPALLKEWLDLVWLQDFAYGEKAALQGKTLRPAPVPRCSAPPARRPSPSPSFCGPSSGWPGSAACVGPSPS
jgi:glutathione-regulated potassium-efflux system ancillary protein KefG